MRVPKVVYKTVISISVLLVVFVGGGVGYTWYVGQHSNEEVLSVATPAVTSSRAPVFTPPKRDPNAPVGASIQSLTSPVLPGDNSSITVRTSPDAKCTVEVLYNKVPSKDSGLSEKTADEYGTVSWAWTVEESVPLGKWPVNVTCAVDDKSAVVTGELVVVASRDEE